MVNIAIENRLKVLLPPSTQIVTDVRGDGYMRLEGTKALLQGTKSSSILDDDGNLFQRSSLQPFSSSSSHVLTKENLLLPSMLISAETCEGGVIAAPLSQSSETLESLEQTPLDLISFSSSSQNSNNPENDTTDSNSDSAIIALHISPLPETGTELLNLKNNVAEALGRASDEDSVCSCYLVDNAPPCKKSKVTAGASPAVPAICYIDLTQESSSDEDIPNKDHHCILNKEQHYNATQHHLELELIPHKSPGDREDDENSPPADPHYILPLTPGRKGVNSILKRDNNLSVL